MCKPIIKFELNILTKRFGHSYEYVPRPRRRCPATDRRPPAPAWHTSCTQHHHNKCVITINFHITKLIELTRDASINYALKKQH